MSRSRLLPPSWPQNDSGFYCLLLHVPRPVYLKAGRLGGTHVEPGYALYVGRARRNLFARLARHMRRRKPRRWHIDYFFPMAAPLGAFVLTDGGLTECAIADRLARRTAVRRIIPGFGASDCRCKGHLLWMPAGKVDSESGSAKVEFRPPLHLAGGVFYPAATW